VPQCFDRKKIEIIPRCRATIENRYGFFSKRNLIDSGPKIIRGKGSGSTYWESTTRRCGGRVECVILGDGNHPAYCEELSKKLGLSDRVSISKDSFRGGI